MSILPMFYAVVNIAEPSALKIEFQNAYLPNLRVEYEVIKRSFGESRSSTKMFTERKVFSVRKKSDLNAFPVLWSTFRQVNIPAHDGVRLLRVHVCVSGVDTARSVCVRGGGGVNTRTGHLFVVVISDSSDYSVKKITQCGFDPSYTVRVLTHTDCCSSKTLSWGNRGVRSRFVYYCAHTHYIPIYTWDCRNWGTDSRECIAAHFWNSVSGGVSNVVFFFWFLKRSIKKQYNMFLGNYYTRVRTTCLTNITFKIMSYFIVRYSTHVIWLICWTCWARGRYS